MRFTEINKDVAEGWRTPGLNLEPMTSHKTRELQRQQGQRPTGPQRLMSELADMLHISVGQLTWLVQRIPGFPPARGRGSSAQGSKGYYDLAAFKRWVIDNQVREKIAARKDEGSLNEFAPSSNPGGGNYLKALASAWYNGTFNTGDLHKGIKSQEDVERILERGIHCGDGKIRKYSIGYNSDFDGVEIQSDDHYEYSDYDDAGRDIDSRTGKPWGPYDVVAFSGNELDESIAEGSKYKCSCHPGDPDPDCPVHGLEPMEVGDALDVKKGVAEAPGAETLGHNQSTVASNLNSLDLDEGNKKPEPPEADYGDDYQAMVSRVKKLAGLGPLRTIYDPAKRVYKNVPTAVQPGDKK